MSDQPEFEVIVTKPDGHVVSARTAAALEELAAAIEEEESDDEVSGFNMLRTGAGARPRIDLPGPLQFCMPMYTSGSSSSDEGSDGGDVEIKESCIGIFF